MKPCKSLNVFFDFEYKEDVFRQMRRVLDAGFTHLDMNFWDWSHDDASPFMGDGWKKWVEDIGAAAESMGGVFTQAHAHVYNFYEDGIDSVHERQIRRSLISAGMLNIPWIVLHPSKDPNGSFNMKDNAEYFKREAEFAAECGTGIAIENTKSALKDAGALSELIDRINMPNVGACWDTGHAHLCGLDQPRELHILGKRLHALHIADNKGETDEHTMPFVGTIDWLPLVAALKDIRYDGDFTFEAHNFVRNLPDRCKADGLKLMYRVGVVLSGND